MENLGSFAVSFLLNTLVSIVIIRGIYYPVVRNKDYVLTFFTFDTLVFLISSLLSGVDLSVGFGFSLFAIFSILRYRTDPMPIREMTYLFTMMALPVVNAVLFSQANLVGLAIANLSVVLVLYLVEKEWGFQYVDHKTISYERIDLIRPENRELLLDDLRLRTGLDIRSCDIGKIDFAHDIAELKVTYREPVLQSSVSEVDKSQPAGWRSQDWQVAPSANSMDGQ
jgi:hypothetical protein